jgi:hypothetical protein
MAVLIRILIRESLDFSVPFWVKVTSNGKVRRRQGYYGG